MSNYQGNRRDSRRDDDANLERRNFSGRQRSAARTRNAGNRSASAPGQRAREGDPARQVAFEVLRDVEIADAYSNLILPTRLRRKEIYGRDAGFATELVYGTLRMQGLYDAILARGLDRPLDGLDATVRVVLRLGAHQLLAMRVPPHAAVSQTVGLARSNVGAGPAQLVNAVLRRVGERSLEEWKEFLTEDVTNTSERLAITYSHPTWVVRALREALIADGRSDDEISELLAADNAPPRVTMVVRPGLATFHDLEGASVTPGKLAETAVILESGDPARLVAVQEGRIGVQDEGSQFVALQLAHEPIEGKDDRWLDLCAGPGGKAALLGALAATRGARLFANEASEHRAKLVEDSLKAVPAEAIETIRTGDGRDLGTLEPSGFDRVLLDAPCTGLGALRRRPESRWRRTPGDVAQLRKLQTELLDSALAAVRPGGIVSYTTCSPHIAETRSVVDDVLKNNDSVELIRATQLWPHVDGTDAMFSALLMRVQ
jgi:16S rRNA (cytosine967-C5)-methyltransferase